MPSLSSRRATATRRLLRPSLAAAVSLVALVLSGLLIGAVGESERTPSATDNLPDGYDSSTVAELADEFGADDSAVAIVLFTADDGELSTETVEGDLTTLYGEVVAAESPQPGESGPPAQQQPLRISEDATAALGVVPIGAEGASETADAIERIRELLDDQTPDGVNAQVTGPAAVQADLAGVFEGADVTLLAATAVIVALLLIITYRSPLLWIVPLLVVGLADQVAAVSATHVLATFGVAWDESTIGILSVLVFGAGTDYALLLISRYRDELRVQQDRYVAMATAVRGTFEAVLASATTVTLGLLTLLLSVVPTTRGLGLACAVGVVIAATYALIVLPCTLVLFGRWVFWPLVPRLGQEPLVDSRTSAWHRLGTTVSRRPRGFALGAVGVVALLGFSVTQIEQGLPTSEQFLDTPESISAAARLGESFPAGTVDPATVITRSDPGEVTTAIEQGDDVVSVRITGQSDDLTRLAVVFDAASNTAAAEDAVVDLRDRLDGFDDTWVGGTEAQSVDERDAAERDRALLIPLILGLVIIGLMLLLRSIVAPLLLVATVVGTFFAALGTSWWIYTGVFGFSAIDVGVPLLAFLFLVALGVDYNIFLITRALEESRAHGLRDGMLRGLTATGGVITSAGILLAAVFAVLGVLPLVVLAQLGIVIFVGVLLDTLLVRTVLVPALSLWLGPGFWWPRRSAAITGERDGRA